LVVDGLAYPLLFGGNMISRHAIKDDETNEAYLTMFRGEQKMRIPKIHWDAVEDRIKGAHQKICMAIPENIETMQTVKTQVIPIMLVNAFEPMDLNQMQFVDYYYDDEIPLLERDSSGSDSETHRAVNEIEVGDTHNDIREEVGTISHHPGELTILCFDDTDSDEESEPPDLMHEDSDTDDELSSQSSVLSHTSVQVCNSDHDRTNVQKSSRRGENGHRSCLIRMKTVMIAVMTAILIIKTRNLVHTVCR